MAASRADFEIIAQGISDTPEHFRSIAEHAAFANEFANYMQRLNPRFDAKRFIMACMPKVYVGGVHERHWEHYARERTND